MCEWGCVCEWGGVCEWGCVCVCDRHWNAKNLENEPTGPVQQRGELLLARFHLFFLLVV